LVVRHSSFVIKEKTMSVKAQYQTLFAYQNHTIKRLLAGAAQLEDASYREHPGFGHGSLHDMFLHLLAASRMWRTVLATGQRPSRLDRDSFPDIASLESGFAEDAAGWQAYLEQLSEEEVEAAVTLARSDGEQNIPRWRVLQHLILHGMQHATEVAHLLTIKDQSPGDIDFIFFNQ
jgi:uncharacterized damage-inducible protein DinB